MTAKVAMIAAVGTNRVIGADNDLPWHIPSDFAFFKRQTRGKPLVMGRRTFESLGGALPDRINIVVTRTVDYAPDGAIVIGDLAEAIETARQIAADMGVDEVMIGGGGVVYEAAMPLADRLYVSHVDLAPEGDTRFPEIDPAVWEVVGEPQIPPSDKDSATFRVKVYERRRPALD